MSASPAQETFLIAVHVGVAYFETFLFLRSYFGESWVVILEYFPVEDSNASPVS